MLVIRKETEKDYLNIYDVVEKAFKNAEHRDGTEQDLVVNLRKGESYIPELSLVAEINGLIVGYIMFSKIQIGENTEIALAPLAVLPEYQKQGIGTKLILEGHKKAKEMGFHYSVVLGSKDYYPRLGYIPAVNYKIQAPFEVEDENFMAIKLNETQTEISGIVKYAKEFGI